MRTSVCKFLCQCLDNLQRSPEYLNKKINYNCFLNKKRFKRKKKLERAAINGATTRTLQYTRANPINVRGWWRRVGSASSRLVMSTAHGRADGTQTLNATDTLLLEAVHLCRITAWSQESKNGH